MRERVCRQSEQRSHMKPAGRCQTKAKNRTTGATRMATESRTRASIIGVPNGEVEGPHRSDRLEPRVHTVFQHPRPNYRLPPPPPTIVRRQAQSLPETAR